MFWRKAFHSSVTLSQSVPGVRGEMEASAVEHSVPRWTLKGAGQEVLRVKEVLVSLCRTLEDW